MSKLQWITDKKLNLAITTLVDRVTEAKEKAQQRIVRNVIDPFSSLVIASTFNIDQSKALKSIQESNSTLSGISSALGAFHQQILGSIAGWKNHDAGYDLENQSRKILAEVKNKHNTMNSSNRQAVVNDLDTAVRQKRKGWTGYLVIIIPKKPIRYENKLNTARPVFEIDGTSFYEKATGDKTALRDLFHVMIDELSKISGWIKSQDIINYCSEILDNSIPK